MKVYFEVLKIIAAECDKSVLSEVLRDVISNVFKGRPLPGKLRRRNSLHSSGYNTHMGSASSSVGFDETEGGQLSSLEEGTLSCIHLHCVNLLC